MFEMFLHLYKVFNFGGVFMAREKSDTIKFQVTMSRDFVARLDEMARKKGLSRSGYIYFHMIQCLSQDERKEADFNKLLESKK